MRVVVIGGTGRIGKRVCGLLASEGHEVLALNRRPERAAVVLADLPVHTSVCDIRRASSISAGVAGADAVVLATAPTREMPHDHLIGTSHVLSAVRSAGAARLVVVSHYKALDAPDGRPMVVAEPPNPYFRELESVFAAQVSLLRRTDDLDWLAVAPAADLYPYGEVTRSWRTAVDTLVVTDPDSTAYPEVSRLSTEDLAAYVVEETVRPTRMRELVGVGY
jgi:putative NADH-flavin reductase